MDLRRPPTLARLHLLKEFDGSDSRAADDQENHRTLFRVILLDFCPFGANLKQENKIMFKNKKQQEE